MKWTVIILLIFATNFVFGNWVLVEQFDNTYNVIKSDVKSIGCYDNKNCFAVIEHEGSFAEADWRLYISKDVGKTWHLIYQSPNIYKQEKPSVLNVRRGISPHPNFYFILSNDYTVLMKSIDSAKTFKKIIIDADDRYPDQFAMYDTSIGFLTNSNSIFTTKDGWETFEKYPLLGKINVYSPQFLDSNTLVMTLVSDQNPLGFVFVKYHLNENRFDSLSFLGFDEGIEPGSKFYQRIYNIYFINDTLGFGCGSLLTETNGDNYFDMIYKTTDGGNNWKTILKEYIYPQIGFTNNISFADEMNGIAVGHYGKIAMTNDGGDTWVYEPYPNDMKNCRKMQVCWAGRTPLIGTWDAGIFRYEGDFFKFPDTTAVEDNLITNYQLLITPNPAGDFIEINFERCPTSLRCRTSNKIEIYNVLGECVKNVSPQSNYPNPDTRTPNTQIKVDVSDLPPGVYLLRIINGSEVFDKQFLVHR